MTKDAENAEPKPLGPAVRLGISLLVTLHLAGVFSAALWQSIFVAYDIFPMPDRERMYGAVPEQPPMAADGLPADAIRIPITPQAGDAEIVAPADQAEDAPDSRPVLLRWMGPYLNQLFMSGGYNFFAPDPGGSFVLRYEVDMPDGSMVQGQWPNLEEQWPRLLYHRYFMLTSQALRFRPEANNARAYADHILRRHGGTRVRLYLLHHFLLRPEQVIEGKDAEAPEMYRVINQYELTADGSEPAPPEEVLPREGR